VVTGSVLSLIGRSQDRKIEVEVSRNRPYLDNFTMLQDSLSEYAVWAGQWFSLQHDSVHATGLLLSQPDLALSDRFSAAARRLEHHSTRCRSEAIRNGVDALMQQLANLIIDIQRCPPNTAQMLDDIDAAMTRWANAYGTLTESMGTEIRAIVP